MTLFGGLGCSVQHSLRLEGFWVVKYFPAPLPSFTADPQRSVPRSWACAPLC